MSVDFSVVIATFRRPKELADAIDSVVGQVGTTVEILVVDDSPEGSARKVVDDLQDPRLRYFKNPHPTGGVPSVVRNLAWPHAKGTYIHFLDDDDIVPDGHYVAVKQAFAANPAVGMVFGRIEPFGACPATQLQNERHYFADAARKSAICRRFGPKWAFTALMLFDKALLVCSASILRRECVEKLGGFDPEIRLMEDADLHVRAMREFGAHFMDRTAVRYRIGSPSLMHSPHPGKKQLDWERAGHRKIQVKYRAQHGMAEFYTLALFARTALKIL